VNVQGVAIVERQERIELGERFFVAGFFLVLLTEVAFGIVAGGLWFSWPRLFLNVVGVLLLLFLVNAVYGGSKTAGAVLLAWVGVSLLLTLPSLVVTTLALRDPSGLALQLGAPAPWLVALKLAAYAVFGLLLLVPVSVRDFLAARRGELPAEDKVAVRTVDAGAPLPLTEAQIEGFAGLAGLMQAAGVVLVAAGLLLCAMTTDPADRFGWLTTVEGGALAILGVVLLLPVPSLRRVAAPETGVGYLAAAFGSLLTLFRVLLLVGLVFLAVVIVRLAVRFSS
jgi:hypothetical protein